MTLVALILALNIMLILKINKQSEANISSKDKNELKIKFVNEGIALAEQMHAHNKKINTSNLTSHDKLKIAMDWARERCVNHQISMSDAELRKLVEIYLNMSSR